MKLNSNFREEFSTKSPTLTLLVIVVDSTLTRHPFQMKAMSAPNVAMTSIITSLIRWPN